jgi:4-amino-4-deoxy-L-arabinose transferase-like glycosyltransferase
MNLKLTSLQIKVAFWVIMAVGIILRLYYMLAPTTPLSADEYVYGVQALNMVQKGEWQPFYYNQNYTGTLTATLTAILFFIFNIESMLVKWPVFFFAVGFLITSYYLAKLIFENKIGALLVMGLTAVTSPFWMNWTTRAGSGYPETMLLGNLIFILVLKNVFEKQSRQFQSWSFFGLGLLSGLGYWIQPTIIYYLLPAAVIIFFWRPKIFFTRLFALGILGFVLGSLPVLIFNLTHQNLNTQSLFHKPFGVKKAIVEFFTVGLPIIFGLRKPFSTVDFSLPLTLLVGGIYLSSFIFLLIKRIPDLLETFTLGLLRGGRKLQITPHKLEKIDLIFLFLVTVIVVFSLSSPFNQFISEPRYVSPLYTALPILIVFLVMEAGRINKIVSALIYLIVLGAQAWGLIQLPPNSFQGPIDLTETIAHLRTKDVTFVDTHAYLSYRLILDSKGSIIAATRDNPPIEARYPLYRKLVDSAPVEKKAWLLDHTQPVAKCTERVEDQLGPCREERLNNGLYLYTWR